jgi:hypothetical protein
VTESQAVGGARAGHADVGRRLTAALVAVSVLHALSSILFRGIHSGYGWDETVYISQIDPHTVASAFSAPRSRGLTLLTAPASYLTASVALMRLWLALLSGVGMFLAFLPWLRLLRSPVVPLAALMWSSSWVSIYYSFEAMPNQYVAYGALACAGWLLLAIPRGPVPPHRRSIWYAGAALAFTALIRPSDAVFVFLALVLALVVVRSQSVGWRVRAASLLAAGLAVGLAEWVVEAFVRFGGPLARLHAASNENGGGVHFSVPAQMRVLAGPLLCRGGCHVDASQLARAWWYVGAGLVVVGALGAWQSQRRLAYAVGYGAPRFLELAYALLALPAAEGVAQIWRRSAGSAGRVAVTAALVVVGAGHEAAQIHFLRTADAHQNVASHRARAVAHYLLTSGIQRPCFVGGVDAGPIAFLAHCHAVGLTRPPRRAVHPHGTLVFVAARRHPVPPDVAGWTSQTVAVDTTHHFTLWILVQPPP